MADNFDENSVVAVTTEPSSTYRTHTLDLNSQFCIVCVARCIDFIVASAATNARKPFFVGIYRADPFATFERNLNFC